MDLGYTYDDGDAIVPDGTDSPVRGPLGTGFGLITSGLAGVWRAAAVAVARELSVEIEVVVVGDGG